MTVRTLDGLAPRALALAGLACASPGALQQTSLLQRCFAGPPTARWELPAAFREVSGLAVTADGRVLLHADEAGILAAFDYRTGRVVATYRLGPATPRDDFEGIAVVGTRLLLVSSQGLLYESRVPAQGPSDLGVLPFEIRDTGLGKHCEIEGLVGDAERELIFLACKTPRSPALENVLTVFRWSLAAGRLADPDRLTVPLGELRRNGRGKGFAASGLDRQSDTGRFLALAAREGAIAEFDPAGRVHAVLPLPRGHRQAEGIVLTSDGALLIADEGGRRAGTVTVYACGAR